MSFAQIPVDNINACYLLNNNYNDAGLFSYDLSPVSSPSFGSDRNGVMNGCLYLDGNSYLIKNSGVIPATGNFSINLWVNHNSMQGGHWNVIGQSYGAMADLNIDFQSSVVTISTWNISYSYPDDDMWHMITLVNSSENAYFYVDGALISSKGSSLPNPDGLTFTIGANSIGQYKVEGFIDDVRIYSDVLTTSEIEFLYSGNNCLRAFYPMNGSVIDLSGNYRNIQTVSGTTLENDRFGNAFQSTYFDGNSDYMKSDSLVIPVSNPFTINVWAKHEISQTGERIILSQDKLGGERIHLGENGSGNVTICESLTETGVNFPDDGEWHMYSVVSNGMFVKLYIDGIKKLESPTALFCPDAAGFYIGQKLSSSGQNFQGNIDDVKVFGCELMDMDIANMFHEGNYGLSSCIESEHSFSASSLSDFTGNGHNATTANTTFVTDRLGTPMWALDFSGTGSKATVPNTGYDFSSGITISGWLKADEYKNATLIDLMGNTGEGIRLGLKDNTTMTFFTGTGYYGDESLAESSQIYELNRYYHVAATWEPGYGEFILYIDGNVAFSGMRPGSFSYTGPIYFGQKDDGLENFNGIIDDVNIYECALNQPEIAFLANQDLFISKQPVNDTVCEGGSIHFELLAMGNPIGYQWYHNGNPIGGEDTSYIDIMVAGPGDMGNYMCEVFGAFGTTYSNVVSTVSPAPEISVSVVTEPSCGGGCNGSLTVNHIDGNPPYFYSWDASAGSQTTQTATNLCEGTYFVNVSDMSGCSANASGTLSGTGGLTIDNFDYQNPSCGGDCDGSITVNVTGGTSPYYYDFGMGNQASNTYNNYCQGIYSVTITDNAGCSVTLSDITLTEPDPITITSATTSDPLCYNVCSGEISASATGGTGILTYSILDGLGITVVTSNFSNTICPDASPYSVHVVDENGCHADATNLYINNPPPLVAYPSATDVSCFGGNDGHAESNAFGGTPGYNYLWSVQSGSPTINPTTPDQIGLSACVLNLVVTDLNGCQTSEIITISQPTDLIVNTTTTNITCFDYCNGEISLGITGGTSTYYPSWTGPDGYTASSGDISGLCDGTYNVTVTDNNGCTETASVNLVNPPQITITSEIYNDASCNDVCDGDLTIIATGGTGTLQYDFGEGYQSDNFLTDLCPASYMANIQDENGCTVASSTMNIYEPSPISLTDQIISHVLCNGDCNGSIEITAIGGTPGYNYGWTGPSGFTSSIDDNSSLCAGFYHLTITDYNACTFQETFEITEPSEILISESHQYELCYGNCDGYIDLMVTGGSGMYEYIWDNSGTFNETTEDVYGLCPDTYFVTVTDINGCTLTETVNIYGPTSAITVYAEDIFNAGCSGTCDGAANAYADGGEPPYHFTTDFMYIQSHGYFPMLCPGSYNIAVIDDNGCVAYSDPFNIAGTSSFDVMVMVMDDATCGENDGEAFVYISGGSGEYDINWSNGDSTMNAYNLGAGMHSVVVTDTISGCTMQQFFTISNTGGATVSGTISNVSCSGTNDGSISLEVTGGVSPYIIEWSNGETGNEIENLFSGSYDVTVTDAAGCMVMESYNLSSSSGLNADFSAENSSCGMNDGSIITNVWGGTSPYSISWSTGSTSADLSSVTCGSYSCTITDAEGCQLTNIITVSDEGAPVVEIDSVHPADCSGAGAIYVSVTGGSGSYTYSWSNGETTQDLIGFPSGNYILNVTDGGCMAFQAMEITGTSPQMQPICVVTVDTGSHTNLVVWDKVADSGIAFYKIYREGSIPGNYLVMDTVPYNDLSEWTDPIANPFTRSWRYKISAVDSCGNESPLSPHHKTIHLTMNAGIGGSYNLIWDDYEGFTYYTYYIHRHTDVNGWETLDSLPKTLHSFADVPPAEEGLWYLVTVNTPFDCYSESSLKDVGGPYSQSVSNLEDTGISVDIMNSSNTEVDIYPNPNNGLFNVISDDMIKGIQISNIGGQRVLTNVENGNSISIDMTGNAPGVYIIRVITETGAAVGKIIKK